MSERHNPAAMLEAAFNGELSLDGEVPTSRQEVEAQQNEEASDQANDDQQATEQTSEKEPEAASTDAEPEGAPIASKSGTYTIPYEKLSQARDEAKKFAIENEQLKQQLAELSAKQQANLAAAEAQAQARAEAGKAQTQADQDLQAAQAAISDGVDVAIFGDFSEEAIAKGIKSLQDQARTQLREQLSAELRSELEKELAPLKQARAQSAAEAHYSAIYAKHADADEVLDSGEFQQWRESLPRIMRASVDAALTQGTAADVVEVFDSFKSQFAVGKPAAPRRPEVERRTVASLSEIAGAPPVDATQRTLQLAGNPSALLDNVMNMTPEQIDALMNRV